MKNGLLQIGGSIPLLTLLIQGVQADVLPPTQEPAGQAASLSLGAVLVLGFLVAIIVIASFLVIRAIRKKQAPKDNA